jgi:UDP-glucose 4-epimerase
MKKAVVFGGAGFLGSHVADILTERKYDCVIYDVKTSEYLRERQRMVIGDVLDEKKVGQAVKNADVVYNFAGIVDLDEAKARPLDTIRANILGNAVILEACRKNAVKRFLYASSIYVYSDAGCFYRSSKYASEMIIEDYAKAFGVDFTIMRYGSLYGPRSGRSNWIYSMLKDAMEKGVIVRKGDGEEIREYIHVLDAARMSVDVLGREYKGQHVVISGSQPIKIKDLLVMVKEMLRNKVEIRYTDAKNSEHYEVTPYSFNPRIARKIMSSSYLDLGQGLLDMMNMLHDSGRPRR